MSARKSAAYYEVDIPNCHTGFADAFPLRYCIKHLSTYVVAGIRRRLVL